MANFKEYVILNPNGTFNRKVSGEVIQELIDLGHFTEDEDGKLTRTKLGDEYAKKFFRKEKPN